MRSSPSIAPVPPDDFDVYLVLDDFGLRLGRAWRETNEERTDRRKLITDLIDGQYSDPARIVAFNTAEGWSRDVWAELADEIVQRSGMDGFDVGDGGRSSTGGLRTASQTRRVSEGSNLVHNRSPSILAL
jgi:hypothetical protein